MRAAVGLQAKNVGRNDFVAMQCDQGMRWSDKLDGGFPIGQLVAHDFGNGQALQRRFNHTLQHLGKYCAWCGARSDQIVLFSIRFASQVGHVQ